MKVIIEIDTDNNAFDDNPEFELSRILIECSEKMSLSKFYNQALYDTNGNLTGKISIVN